MVVGLATAEAQARGDNLADTVDLLVGMRSRKLLGFECDGAVLDSGTPESYRAAEDLFARLAA
jgi:hypothetical protein